jgi:hypothetical protein
MSSLARSRVDAFAKAFQNSVGKFIRSLLLLSLITCLVPLKSNAGLILTLNPDSENAQAGDIVIFTGSIVNTTGVPLNASDLFLNFSGGDPGLTEINQLLGLTDFTLPNNTFSPQIDLFSATISPSLSPGTYTLFLSLEDINNDLSDLVSAQVEISGSAASVPDSNSSLVALILGMAICKLFCRKFEAPFDPQNPNTLSITEENSNGPNCHRIA